MQRTLRLAFPAFSLAIMGFLAALAPEASARPKGYGMKALASREAEWGSAFGQQEQPAGAAAPAAAATAVPGVEEEKLPAGIDEAFDEVGSFPLRLRHGRDANKAWNEEKAKTFNPRPASKRYALRGCEFELKTGALSVRQYARTASADYVVRQDSIVRYSTLTANTPLYVSLTSDLVVEMKPGTADACRKALAGKRVLLGQIGLGNSEIAAVNDALQLPGNRVASGEEPKVYLTFDVNLGRLVVEDKAGLQPSVESGVYALAPDADGDYYLKVAPKLTLARP